MNNYTNKQLIMYIARTKHLLRDHKRSKLSSPILQLQLIGLYETSQIAGPRLWKEITTHETK